MSAPANSTRGGGKVFLRMLVAGMRSDEQTSYVKVPSVVIVRPRSSRGQAPADVPV